MIDWSMRNKINISINVSSSSGFIICSNSDKSWRGPKIRAELVSELVIIDTDIFAKN